MKINKGIKRFFENGYRQACGHKTKKSMSLKQLIKKIIKKLMFR